MHIASWNISGFGHFQDLHHTGLPRGLVVVYGPNEAGKSTLLAFLLFVLFGKERGRRVHALGGGRLGGRIELVLDDSSGGRRTVTVERFDDEPPVVLDGGQRLSGEEAVARLLGGTDRKLFQSIYAFSLADLNSLEGLGDGATRERLFAGAVAGAGRSVAEARRNLAREHDKLWRARADCSLRTTLTALNVMDAQLALARRETSQLATLRRAIDQAQTDRLRHESEAMQAAARGHFATALAVAWPQVADAHQARAEIETLNTEAVLEPAQADTLRSLLDTAARVEQEQAATQEALAGAEARRDRIAVAAEVLDAGPRIRALAANLDAVRTAHETVERFAARAPLRQTELDGALKRSGFKTLGQLAAVDLSHARVVALQRAAEALREAERAQGVLRRAEDVVLRAEADLARKATAKNAVHLDPVAERQGARIDRLTTEQPEVMADQALLPERRQTLEAAAEIHGLELRAGYAGVALATAREAEGAADQAERGVLPWALMLGGLLLLLCGGFIAAAGNGAVGALVVVLAAVCAVIGWYLLRFAVTMRQKAAKNQSDADAWARQRDALATRLGLAPGPLALVALTERLRMAEEARRSRQVHVQRWQADLATVREACGLPGSDAEVLLAALDRCATAQQARKTYEVAAFAWEAAQANLELSQRALTAATAEAAHSTGASAQWIAARNTAGLHEAVGPEALDTALALTEVAQRLALDCATAEAASEEARQRVQAWLQAAQDLGGDLDRPVPADATGAIEFLRTLDACRHDAEAARQWQAVAHEEVAERQAKLELVAARLQLARTALEDGLRACGLENPEAIRLAVERATRAAACRERIALAETGVRGLLGAAADDAAVQARLAMGDLAGWQAEAAIAGLQAEEARAARDSASSHLGRLHGDLARLEAATDIPDKDAERARLQAMRTADLHKLAVLSLADHLLGQTLVRFRQRHAPGVFRVASEHLRDATTGTYSQVEANADYSDLVIHDARQGTRAPEDLSRGTKDLLYFALRLGLAREQHPGGQTLPLVLDDILVNLDPERAEGVCRVIAQEAAVRQVVLLTCRPETLAMVRAHVPEVAVVTLDRFGGRSVPVTRPARQERGRGRSGGRGG